MKTIKVTIEFEISSDDNAEDISDAIKAQLEELVDEENILDRHEVAFEAEEGDED